MIVIVGLVVLLAAVIVGFTGVLTNAGAAHPLTENFSVFGYHVTGMLGLSVLLAGARRTAGRGRDARRDLQRSQRETAFLNRDRDKLLEQQQGADTGSPVHSDGATTRRDRVPLLGRWSRGRQPKGTAPSTAPARHPTPITENEGVRNEHR